MHEQPESRQPTEGREFHLLERIGSGAWGEVYVAEQRSGQGAGFQRRVAIKVLQADQQDDDLARRIRDEARILGRVDHRNVVTVFDLVRLDDRWAVVMEYVPGCDLERLSTALRLAGERMPVRAACEVGACIASALHAAFNAPGSADEPLRVVHRDVKPSNVRLTPDGDVKVLDFGIARGDLSHREGQTGGRVLGTPLYMSPERFSGRSAEASGDIYATFKLVTELLLGHTLGVSPSDSTTHERWLAEVLDSVEERLGDAPVATLLLPLLEGGMSFQPATRPSASEAADELTYLARATPGQSLVEFAGEFVPRVHGLTGSVSEQASGVLSERVTGSGPRASDQTLEGGDDAVRHTPLPPMLPPTPPPVTPRPGAWSDPPPPARRSPIGWLLVAAAALLGVVGLALAALLVSGALERRPAPEPAEPELVSSVRTEPVPRPPPEVAVEPAPEPASSVRPDPAPAPEPGPAPRPALASEPAPRPVAPSPVPGPAPSPVAPPSSPAPEPAPVPERPPPVEEPAVAEVAPAPAPILVAVPAAAPQPEPAVVETPEPAPAPPVPFTGTWVGTAAGVPFTLHVLSSDGGAVTARGEMAQGPTIRSFDLVGSIGSEGELVLRDAGTGMAFEGRVVGPEASGDLVLKRGAAQPWSVRRQ